MWFLLPVWTKPMACPEKGECPQISIRLMGSYIMAKPVWMFVRPAWEDESLCLLAYINIIGVDIVRIGIPEQRVQFHPVTVIWNRDNSMSRMCRNFKALSELLKLKRSCIYLKISKDITLQSELILYAWKYYSQPIRVSCLPLVLSFFLTELISQPSKKL